MKKIIGALLVVLSHAFIPWRAPPPMPRMPQRLLSESNEEQLRDQLEETSTTLTTEQATRLAELEERGGGSQRDEEVMSALTAELGYVPLVGSRVLEALDATLDNRERLARVKTLRKAVRGEALDKGGV